MGVYPLCAGGVSVATLRLSRSEQTGRLVADGGNGGVGGNGDSGDDDGDDGYDVGGGGDGDDDGGNGGDDDGDDDDDLTTGSDGDAKLAHHLQCTTEPSFQIQGMIIYFFKFFFLFFFSKILIDTPLSFK